MSETRRATVMLIQRGDPEIGGALMAGVIPVKWNQSAPSKILSQSKSSGLASWIAE